MGWVSDRAAELSAKLDLIKNDLAVHPEPAWAEVRTSQVVHRELTQLGWAAKIFERSDGPDVGVVAELEVDPDAPWILLRADIDALSIDDTRVDSPYRSQNPGVHHGCGHNMHTAGLLGSAQMIMEAHARGELKNNIRLVFEPAEEVAVNGASYLIREHGVLHKVDAVFGVHAWPRLRLGEVGVREGAIQRGIHHVTWEFEGMPGHTGRPHEGDDIIDRMTDSYKRFKHEMSRSYRWDMKAEFAAGFIHAGSVTNTTPGSGTLGGTVRTATLETYLKVPEQLEKINAQLRAEFGIRINMRLPEGVPPAQNTHRDHMAGFLATELGWDKVKDVLQLEGTDPFAFYHAGTPANESYAAVPGAPVSHYFQIGVASPDPSVPVDTQTGLHDGKFEAVEGSAAQASVVYTLAALHGMPPTARRSGAARPGHSRPPGTGIDAGGPGRGRGAGTPLVQARKIA